MELFHVLILALLQGLTEFLPISSSAHLILVPQLVHWEDQGLAFDVAVHVGTLAAVVGYFRHELVIMAKAWFRSLRGNGHSQESDLTWAVLVASIPVCIVGWQYNDVIETSLRSPIVIAMATIGFAVLLWWADRVGQRVRDERSIGLRDVVLIGLAQVTALIPGASRSGVTMTAGLFVGLDRSSAARFSFLLAIPVIVLAGVYKATGLAMAPGSADWPNLIVGAIASGVSAFACIHFFLKLLERIGFLPFVLYRLILGGLLFLLFT